MEIFGVECCATLYCDWPILMVRKICGRDLDRVPSDYLRIYI